MAPQLRVPGLLLHVEEAEELEQDAQGHIEEDGEQQRRREQPSRGAVGGQFGVGVGQVHWEDRGRMFQRVSRCPKEKRAPPPPHPPFLCWGGGFPTQHCFKWRGAEDRVASHQLLDAQAELFLGAPMPSNAALALPVQMGLCWLRSDQERANLMPTGGLAQHA